MPLSFDNLRYDETGNVIDLENATVIPASELPSSICALLWRFTNPDDLINLILRHAEDAEKTDGSTTSEILALECGKCGKKILWGSSEKWIVNGRKYGRNLMTSPIYVGWNKTACPEEEIDNNQSSE